MTSLALATVVTTAGTAATVRTNDTATDVTLVAGLAVSPDDVVIITKVGPVWFAVARAYSPAPVEPPPAAPPPKPTVTTGTLVVSPVETRSYRPSYGWRSDTSDVYQGQYGGWGNHTGCAFYGPTPRSLAGSTVTGARLQVRRVSGGVYAAQATTMRLMTQATRPDGAPTLTSSTAGPSLAVGATINSFAVPTSWLQSMVDGTAGGLAFFDADGSPYVRFAGRGSWSPAFTLTINWRRG